MTDMPIAFVPGTSGMVNSTGMVHSHFVTTVSRTPFPGSLAVQGTDGLGNVSTYYVGPGVSKSQLVPNVPEISSLWTHDRLSNDFWKER